MKVKSSENKSIDYPAGDKILTFNTPLVMAIVNLTPDSFYDGGKYGRVNDVLNDIEEKIEQGADIVDFGAASSRPGATEISEEEEWLRLKSVLIEARTRFPQISFSVDTYRSNIATYAADLGANIINDIGGGNLDANMFATITKLQLPYIMMHMQGTPKNMQLEPSYENAVEDIYKDFKVRINRLSEMGFHKLILDPGFGFGKTTEHNFQLLKYLQTFTELKFPLLVGVSRKSMINKVIGTNPVTALNGSTVLHTIALLNGASILRTHDVVEAKQAIRLVEYYKNV